MLSRLLFKRGEGEGGAILRLGFEQATRKRVCFGANFLSRTLSQFKSVAWFVRSQLRAVF
jgi:hypothetical protein